MIRQLAVSIVGCAALLIGAAAASPNAQTGSLAGMTCVPRWRAVAKGAGVPELYDVSARSPMDVWALGGDPADGMLVAHWDGRRLQVTRPFGSSSLQHLSAILALGRADVWAVGYSGTEAADWRPLVLRWNGRRWAAAATPAPRRWGRLDGITAFGADDVWVVGKSGADALVMRWNGRRWRVVYLGRSAPNSGLNAIDGTSARDVWAVGEQDYDASDFAGWMDLVLHWDGRAWTAVPARKLPPELAQDGDAEVVSALLPDNVWTLHTSWADGGEDAIARWKSPGRPLLVATFGARTIGDLAAVSKRSVWAVGHWSPHSLLARWDGTAFRVQRTALDRLKNVSLRSLSVVSSTEIWAAGDHLLARYSCA